ncbi:hypothetical protein K6972_07275 [Streptococcus suis]|nr:hypothetical protein K6972_07275 [Streptococcus suis]
MKIRFNKYFYRFSNFYSMIFWICFLLPTANDSFDQWPLWYTSLILIIIPIHIFRAFFLNEEKELTRMGYIFYIGLIVLIIFLRFILGK